MSFFFVTSFWKIYFFNSQIFIIKYIAINFLRPKSSFVGLYSTYEEPFLFKQIGIITEKCNICIFCSIRINIKKNPFV